MSDGGGDKVATGHREKWPGGFIRKTKRGQTVFVIERHIDGAYFKVSTRCTTVRAALKELERFELDPVNYLPGILGAERLIITEDLVLEHRDWQIEVKGNTPEWARNCASLLADWMEDLGGKDLRTLRVHVDIIPALRARRTSKAQRTIALKGFFRWLRVEKGLLKHAEDVSLDIPIPRPPPSRLTTPRDVPLDYVRRVAPHLKPEALDVLRVLVGTGWHVSEVRRFASSGEVKPDPSGKHLAILVTWHKRKEWASTYAQLPETVEAARRIRGRGRIHSNWWLGQQMKKACLAANVPPIHLGGIRHSSATWATEAGAEPGDIAKALNHSTPKTTRDHYIRQRVPLGVMPVQSLRLVEP